MNLLLPSAGTGHFINILYIGQKCAVCLHGFYENRRDVRTCWQFVDNRIFPDKTGYSALKTPARYPTCLGFLSWIFRFQYSRAAGLKQLGQVGCERFYPLPYQPFQGVCRPSEPHQRYRELLESGKAGFTQIQRNWPKIFSTILKRMRIPV